VTDAEFALRLNELEKKFSLAEQERDEYRRLYLEMMERCRKLERGIGLNTAKCRPPHRVRAALTMHGSLRESRSANDEATEPCRPLGQFTKAKSQ
jgi:hypothetical protein